MVNEGFTGRRMSGTEEEVCRAAWVVIGLEILLPGEALEGVWDMGTARNNALRLLASLKAEAERVAAEEGTTMNQFINVAVAEKLAALRTERYFRERILGHWLLRVFPLWSPPPPKESIRAPYTDDVEVLSRPA